MSKKNLQFASLFKKYRLRSEIETLAEFGDLLAQEGIVYESSLFTRWQKGERVPNERRVILAILKIFIKKKGITSLNDANNLLKVLGMNYLTEEEVKSLPDDGNSQSFPMQSSLGGLIKDFRIQKNISQLEISLALGWDNVSKLEEIEQGRIDNPSRNLLDRLMEAMKLEDEDKNRLLLIGGHLPTESEIEKIRTEMSIINTWTYSAILFDFSWRVIYFNQKVIDLYKIDAVTEMYIKDNHPSILEIVFNLDFIPNQKFEGKERERWREFLVYFVLRFRYAQRFRSKEEWYINLIKTLMKNHLFRDIWLQTQKTKPLSIYNFGIIDPIIHPQDSEKRLKIFFSMVPLLKDQRFELELDTPGDIETFKYFLSLE